MYAQIIAGFRFTARALLNRALTTLGLTAKRVERTIGMCWQVGEDNMGLDSLPFEEMYTRVYEIVGLIPRGKVATYGQIAALLHKHRAARAVGAALARNPMPILIPCHRVVAADGHLTGYLGSKGISTKQWLLEREGHRIVGQKLG